MAAKKKSTKTTPLQDYLSQTLTPFKRGTADCVAFAAGWVNKRAGEEVIKLKPLTFGDVVRALRRKPLADQVAETIEPLGWKPRKSKFADGDLVIIKHEEATGGFVVAIYSEGKAITRLEKADLFVIQEPEIVQGWTLK